MKIKIQYTILCSLIALFFSGCGSKKVVSQSERKEKTGISLIDSSKINTKIEKEAQYIDTQTKERIITFYGARFDTIYVEGEPVVIPSSYPLKSEIERDIQIQNRIWKLSVKDSVQNAIDLKYKNQLDEKYKKMLETKESTVIYQIALLILSIIALLFIILFIRYKK